MEFRLTEVKQQTRGGCFQVISAGLRSTLGFVGWRIVSWMLGLYRHIRPYCRSQLLTLKGELRRDRCISTPDVLSLLPALYGMLHSIRHQRCPSMSHVLCSSPPPILPPFAPIPQHSSSSPLFQSSGLEQLEWQHPFAALHTHGTLNLVSHGSLSPSPF